MLSRFDIKNHAACDEERKSICEWIGRLSKRCFLPVTLFEYPGPTWGLHIYQWKIGDSLDRKTTGHIVDAINRSNDLMPDFACENGGFI